MTFLLPIILCLILFGWGNYLSCPRRRAAFFQREAAPEASWGLTEVLLTFLLYVGITWAMFPTTQSLFAWSFPPGPTITSPALSAATAAPAANNPAITTAAMVVSNSALTATRLLAEERKLWIMAAGTLLAVLFSSCLLPNLRKGHVGWSFSFLSRDLRLASLAIVLCLPLVFLVQAIVVQLPGMEYEHPLMRLLLDNPSPRLWLALAITAIVAAPIAEEFFFRGLLQGWFEKLVCNRYFPDQTDTDIREAGDNRVEEELTAEDEPLPKRPPFVACLPVLLGSAAFSAAHFNHGGGWVAIFVLAIGLGILYHKTHRLLPCILLHMALNATSLGLAYLASQAS